MVNAVMAFDKSPLPSGKAAALITNSGGFSVIQTDLCLKEGIEVPPFTAETVRALRELVPLAGTSIANPLDAWPIFYNISSSGNLADIIRIVSSDRNIHSVVFQFDQFRYLRRVLGRGVDAHMKRLIELMLEGCLHARDKGKKAGDGLRLPGPLPGGRGRPATQPHDEEGVCGRRASRLSAPRFGGEKPLASVPICGPPKQLYFLICARWNGKFIE